MVNNERKATVLDPFVRRETQMRFSTPAVCQMTYGRQIQAMPRAPHGRPGDRRFVKPSSSFEKTPQAAEAFRKDPGAGNPVSRLSIMQKTWCARRPAGGPNRRYHPPGARRRIGRQAARAGRIRTGEFRDRSCVERPDCQGPTSEKVLKGRWWRGPPGACGSRFSDGRQIKRGPGIENKSPFRVAAALAPKRSIFEPAHAGLIVGLDQGQAHVVAANQALHWRSPVLSRWRSGLLSP